LVDALTGAVFSSYRPTRFTDRSIPSEVSIGKYCQFIIIFTKYWGNIITHIPPRISRDRPHASPPNFPGRPTGWGNSESTVTVLPSTAVFFHGTYRGAQSVVRPNTNVGTPALILQLPVALQYIAMPKHRQMYETLKSAFEHRSHDRMSARARRPAPLLTGDWETHQRMSKCTLLL